MSIERGEEVKVTEDVNFPPVRETTEAAWKESLRRLEETDTKLRNSVLKIPESRLYEPGVEGGSGVYILLHGAVQHTLYHTGQIMLLKKAVYIP